MPRSKPTITYKKKDGIAIISMNRPEYNNAQNGKMTYDLDKAFKRAVDDDEIKVIVLKGNGKHFSAGRDIGTPGILLLTYCVCHFCVTHATRLYMLFTRDWLVCHVGYLAF